MTDKCKCSDRLSFGRRLLSRDSTHLPGTMLQRTAVAMEAEIEVGYCPASGARPVVGGAYAV